MSHEQIPREDKRQIIEGIPGVFSVGESHDADGNTIAVVTVDKDSSTTEADIPATLAGFPVEVRFDEPVRSFVSDEELAALPQAHTSKVRPVAPGTSTGNLSTSGTGTIGPLMESGGNYYITTNWHVWDFGDGSSGDYVSQPSAGDGGGGGDAIGQMQGSVDHSRDLDAAWATPLDSVGLTSEIYNVGDPSGSRSPQAGEDVVKSGRTTGVTYGTVDQANVAVKNADTGETLYGQALVAGDSAGGDSGSPVMATSDNRIVGLLWGGTEGSSTWVMNDITDVESYMGASVATGVNTGGGGGGGGDPTNEPPRADFTATPDGLTVHVDASAAEDPDGQIIGYHWDFGDGSSATGVTASHTYSSPGTYNVQLTVEDNDGASNSFGGPVTVSDDGGSNTPPTSAFQYEVDGDTVTASADLSDDPDGRIVEYYWEVYDDGTSDVLATYYGESVGHTFTESGDEYGLALVVTDDEGASDRNGERFSVDVPEPNDGPTAAFDYQVDGMTLTADAEPSYDPDGEIIDYHWEVYDDGTGDVLAEYTGRSIGHMFDSPGDDYGLAVVVTDDAGATDREGERFAVGSGGGGGGGEGREAPSRAALAVGGAAVLAAVYFTTQ